MLPPPHTSAISGFFAAVFKLRTRTTRENVLTACRQSVRKIGGPARSVKLKFALFFWIEVIVVAVLQPRQALAFPAETSGREGIAASRAFAPFAWLRLAGCAAPGHSAAQFQPFPLA